MKKLVQMFVLISVVSFGFQAKADLAAELKEREQVAAVYKAEQVKIAAAAEVVRHEAAIMEAKSKLNDALAKVNQLIEVKLKAHLVETKLTQYKFGYGYLESKQNENFESAAWIIKTSDGTICQVSYRPRTVIYRLEKETSSSYGGLKRVESQNEFASADCLYQNGQPETLYLISSY